MLNYSILNLRGMENKRVLVNDGNVTDESLTDKLIEAMTSNRVMYNGGIEIK